MPKTKNKQLKEESIPLNMAFEQAMKLALNTPIPKKKKDKKQGK